MMRTFRIVLGTMLLLTGLLLVGHDARADRCIGSVVNGECIGVIQPDYTNPSGRPADTFTPDRRGLHTSPTPGPAFKGYEFQNRTRPMLRGGELRWMDPDEQSDE
jgi:hypothetical protein